MQQINITKPAEPQFLEVKGRRVSRFKLERKQNNLLTPTMRFRKNSLRETFEEKDTSTNRSKSIDNSPQSPDKPEQTEIEITRIKYPVRFTEEDEEILHPPRKQSQFRDKDNEESSSDSEKAEFALKSPVNKFNYKCKGGQKKRLYQNFYYKNLLIIDKEFGNAIFEIFEPEYDPDFDRPELIKNEDFTQHVEQYEGEIFINRGKISESHEDNDEEEIEDPESEERDYTVGDTETPQNESHVLKLMNASNKLIRARKKVSAKNALKLKLVGESTLHNLFKAVNKRKEAERAQQKEEARVYGTANDPEFLFHRGDYKSDSSENLESITSQNDLGSQKSVALFTYETEKRLFAPAALKPKSRKPQRSSELMRMFKRRSTHKFA